MTAVRDYQDYQGSDPITGFVKPPAPTVSAPGAPPKPPTPMQSNDVVNVRTGKSRPSTQETTAGPRSTGTGQAAAGASNRNIAAQVANVQKWNDSGLNGQLSTLIGQGNFAGAFQLAAQTGQLDAMINSMNLQQLVPGGKWTQAQFDKYYEAFAPYQNRLANTSQDPYGMADAAWNLYSAGEASHNWQDAQKASVGMPYVDVPDPVQFGHSTAASNIQMTGLIAGIGLTAAAPILAPEVGAALGIGTVAGGAITGAVAGGVTGYGNTGSASGAAKGAAIGAAGGALAGGGAKAIADVTGLTPTEVSIATRTAIGGVTGGVQGAEASAIGATAGAGLQTAGVPQMFAAPAAAMLGARAASALNSPSGATMPAPNQNQAAIDTTGTGAMQPSPTDPTGGGTAWYDPLTSPAGILTGIGLAGAAYGQHQTNSEIAPITNAGAPFQAAGETLLNDAMNNRLTPQQQQVVSTSQSQGQTLINAATPVGQIAQGLMQQYQSGQLKPADQTQLDQQTTAAKAQIAQSLGPNVDSTTLATYYNQIDQQAAITKQNILNSYLATGNTEFDQWAATTEAGQATILAGQQYAVSQIDQTFQDALGASALGSGNILAGIQQQMQANQNLANAFQSYMGNLAKAWALGKAGGAGGGAGAGAGGGGGIPSGALGSPTGGPSGIPAADQSTAASDLNYGTDTMLNQDLNMINTSSNDTFAGSMPAYTHPFENNPTYTVSIGGYY